MTARPMTVKVINHHAQWIEVGFVTDSEPGRCFHFDVTDAEDDCGKNGWTCYKGKKSDLFLDLCPDDGKPVEPHEIAFFEKHVDSLIQHLASGVTDWTE